MWPLLSCGTAAHSNWGVYVEAQSPWGESLRDGRKGAAKGPQRVERDKRDDTTHPEARTKDKSHGCPWSFTLGNQEGVGKHAHAKLGSEFGEQGHEKEEMALHGKGGGCPNPPKRK